MANATTGLQVHELPGLLKKFAQSPLEAVKQPVRFTWATAFVLQITIAAISGAIAGAINQSSEEMLIGAIEFPIIITMIIAVMTLFTYYYFSNFAATFLDIRRLYSLVILANLPYFILHALSSLLSPLDLIGFAFTSALLTVGLAEQFSLNTRVVITLAATMFGAFFVVWAVVQFAIA